MIHRHQTVMRGCFPFAVIWGLPIPSTIKKMHIREGIVEIVCFELFISFPKKKKTLKSFPSYSFSGFSDLNVQILCMLRSNSNHSRPNMGRVSLASKHVLL